MKRLPLLLSLPHAGLRIPPEAARYNALQPEEIAADGDAGAHEIYGPLSRHVQALVTTDVARAFIDMNRAPDDIRKDGVVKTHTCWDVPIYTAPLPQEVQRQLIARYHRPYHQQLAQLGTSEDFVLGVDCHTMAAFGPPVAPDPHAVRPLVCLSNADGTCPPATFERLADALRDAFGKEHISLNHPFRGGYIIRHHGQEMPWVQLELSRAPVLDHAQKRERVLSALTRVARARADR